MQAFDDVPRAVAASVVHEDDFVAQASHGLANALPQLFQTFLFVQQRDHHRHVQTGLAMRHGHANSDLGARFMMAATTKDNTAQNANESIESENLALEGINKVNKPFATVEVSGQRQDKRTQGSVHTVGRSDGILFMWRKVRTAVLYLCGEASLLRLRRIPQGRAARVCGCSGATRIACPFSCPDVACSTCFTFAENL